MSQRIVLVDFSQAVISACAANAKDLKDNGDGDAKSYIKHLTLGMILSWKKKFNGRIILACDAKGSYWRNVEYPHYKGHRTHDNTDFLDWDMVYEVINELKDEIKRFFPYMLLEVQGAEADDIVAILIEYFQENELVQTGLMEEPAEIVIVSTDGDFQQLQKYQNVKQWNNVQKKMIVCSNPAQYLIEHTVRGDSGDNIPSITTGDEWSKLRAEGVSTRAKSFTTARLEDFFTKGIDACLNEEERRNYKRNEKLVDLSRIPVDINKKVVDEYLNYEISGNKAKVFNYLTKNRMKILLGSVADF